MNAKQKIALNNLGIIYLVIGMLAAIALCLGVYWQINDLVLYDVNLIRYWSGGGFPPYTKPILILIYLISICGVPYLFVARLLFKGQAKLCKKAVIVLFILKFPLQCILLINLFPISLALFLIYLILFALTLARIKKTESKLQLQ